MPQCEKTAAALLAGKMKRLLYRLQLVYLPQSTSNTGCEMELWAYRASLRPHGYKRSLPLSQTWQWFFSKGRKHYQPPHHRGGKSPQWMWLIICVCACLYVCVEGEETVQHFTSIFQVKWNVALDPANVCSLRPLHYCTDWVQYVWDRKRTLVALQLCLLHCTGLWIRGNTNKKYSCILIHDLESNTKSSRFAWHAGCISYIPDSCDPLSTCKRV